MASLLRGNKPSSMASPGPFRPPRARDPSSCCYSTSTVVSSSIRRVPWPEATDRRPLTSRETSDGPQSPWRPVGCSTQRSAVSLLLLLRVEWSGVRCLVSVGPRAIILHSRITRDGGPGLSRMRKWTVEN